MSASTFHVERAISSIHDTDHGAAGPVQPIFLRHPSLTTTVPKEFVHRASVAEVMLTGWTRRDDSHFTVAAQWPRRHGFFATVDGYHDPLLVAETIRQTGLLLAHAEFGVPLGHQFLMWDLSVDVRPEHLLIETTPAAPELEVVCTDIKRRGNSISGLHLTVVIRRDGQVAATGSATFNCTSPTVYRRLRAAQIGDGVPAPLPLTSPIAPQDVGRVSPTDVVLSPAAEPDCWQLRVDTRHPVLFDHPVDHVPGMVLLEAARQAAAAFLERACLPVRVTSEFTRYAELGAPCMIKVCGLAREGSEPERLLVTGHQDGQVIFSSVVTVAPETD